MPMCLFQPETLKSQGAIHQAPIPVTAMVEAHVKMGVPQDAGPPYGDRLPWILSALPMSQK